METPIPYNKDITYFGKTNFRNHAQVFGIKRRDRRQHMYVLGKSGTGKSVLLSNLIVQNIQNGEGVCVVDPHGELVEEVLDLIPDHRVKDVIYFNPADADFHIGFNVIQLDDPKYKHLVASGLMGIFTKIWANAWSSRMEYILNNAILALLDTPGTTLLGIPRMLVDKDYRQMVIGNLKDPVVKAFWVHEYEQWRDQFRNEAIAPIQNKVGQFLSTSIIRNVVGQPKSTINIFDIMNEGKIFLVNVSKGRVGEDNSALLGGMIITKIQLAAMERVRIPEDERKDFYLYVDEFQNFATDSFANILSEARKYRLNLIIAHQYTAQLETKDGSKVRDAVFGNVGTMIIFRVGADDADFLEKEFEPEFMASDLVNLPNYHVYLKLMIDGVTSRPFSASTLPPIKVDKTIGVKQKIIDSSRKLYTRSKEEVEEEIMRWSGMLQSTDGDATKFKATCDNCGKEIMVPFEPQPGKPVYCKECLAKIKEGSVTPAKGFIQPKAFKQEQVNAQPLAALGIEFSADGTKAMPGANKTDTVPQARDGKPASAAPYVKTRPPFIEKKKSGPSPLLKGLLQNIGFSKKSAEESKDVPAVEVKEVRQDAPPPISLSSLKKPEKVENKTETASPKSPLPDKSAPPEKMNALKAVLANAAPKVAPTVVEAPKPEIKPQPVVMPKVELIVEAPKPEIKVEPIISEPIKVEPPKAQPSNIEINVESVNITMPEKKPEPVIEVPKAPIVENKAEPVLEIPKVEVKKEEPKIEEKKDDVVTPNQSQTWQKNTATKEVPEDVLKKILE